MAIYHLHAKVIQRSKGRNAVASAAYRRAAKLFDEKEQREWDYTNKPDVVHSELLVPENAPAWAKALVELHKTDPSQASADLWNSVEATEKRKDAQLAREIEFALPLELTQEQNIALAREFICDQFVLRGMVADWNVHYDDGNPHVHVMLSMRELVENGFGLKVREWNSKAMVHEWRRQWSEYANFHLRLHRHDVKIDHRSYQEQGIDLVPTVHLGKAVSDMDRRGIQTDLMFEANGIRRENLSRIAANPQTLFNKISAQTPTFTGQQLGQELGRYINDQGKFSVQNGVMAEAVLQNLNELEQGVFSQQTLTPEIIAGVLKSIEQHESVFTQRNIATALEPFTQNAELFAKALVQIKASPELIYLGAGDDGRDRFTTRGMFNLENEIQKSADQMRDSRHARISNRRIHAVLEKYQNAIGKYLTDEQMTAVRHVLKPSAIACIVGRAGTGKSFSLGAAKAVWEAQGLRVLGVALSGIAADGLSKDAGIESRTIESFRLAVEKGQIVLTEQDVIVMDEAGMADSVSMLAVLQAVRNARAKLVLVGDHAQIQPVGPGATFRALLERLGFAEIQTVYRQKEEWQRNATVMFSAGKAAEGLAAYESHGCVHFGKTENDTVARLVTDWSVARASGPKDLNQYLVIAHRNADVKLLNERLRAERLMRGEIAEGHLVYGQNSKMNIARDDRILFLKNDRHLGVSNGRFATVQSVNFTETGRVLDFTVILDGTDKEVVINPTKYREFDYGYAATVHKVQGMTVDHAFVYAGGASWNRHLTYVALSRHRNSCRLYADKSTHRDLPLLQRCLGRYGIKDSLLDFPLAFAERRGIDTTGLSKYLPCHLAERLAGWKNKLENQLEQAVNPERFAERKLYAAQEKLKAEKVAARREDARLVAAYVDANRAVGKAWQDLQTRLYALGLDNMTYEKEAFELISGTTEHAALKNSQLQRNALAFQIVQDVPRYEKAVGIYELDLDKLKNQAGGHECHERVKQYAAISNKGAVVRRDRLAADILKNIKGHYGYLQDFGLQGRDVRAQAAAHLRRQAFVRLTAAERQAFRDVEAYQSAARRVGALWSSEIKESKDPLKRAKLARSDALSFERDRLAGQILTDRIHYDKALDFYQIGTAKPYFEEKLTEQQSQQATERWYKLQQAAARHTLRERVTAYGRAVSSGDVNARLLLAHEIVQEAKAHHGAVINLKLHLKSDTAENWQAVRKDAKQYERHEYYSQLAPTGRLGFKTVEAYVEAKRATAAVMRELFETREAEKLDDKQFYAAMSSHGSCYLFRRNQLAANILENVPLCQAGLDYFKINTDELNPRAQKHRCRENAEQYKNTTDFLTRAKIAVTMVADPKAHHGAVIENGIQWKDIYNNARAAERQQLFEGLGREEKTLHRLGGRYRAMNRTAGRLYSAIKTRSNDKALSADDSARINRAFAKRDYLAWRLVNCAYSISPEQLTEFAASDRLKTDKLVQQHAAHTERSMTVERCQSAYQAVVRTAREVHSDAPKEKTASTIQNALMAAEAALHLQKIFVNNKLDSFDYALQGYGLLRKDLSGQMQTLPELKNHLMTLAHLHKLDNKKIAEKLKARMTNISADVQTHYQRTDVSRLREDLNARAEEAAHHYLGAPKTKSGNTWRYGSNKGSLAVTVRGPKQGKWRDFQTGEGGDILGLIGHATGTAQFKDILQEAVRFAGGGPSYVQQTQKIVHTKTPGADAETLNKIQKARDIYHAGGPVKGTLAERYLREHRGVQGDIDGKTFLFHPKLENWMRGGFYPALIVAARNSSNEVCGVQAIFLNSQTGGKEASLGDYVKLSRGLIGEGAVVHQGRPSGKIAFAEGAETALSVAEAHPDWTVWTTFGVSNFNKVPLKAGKSEIVLCADNDGRDSGTAKSVERAASVLSQNGIDVWVAEPTKPEHKAKWDFNDALLAEGTAQIKKDLDAAVLYKTGITVPRVEKDLSDAVAALNKLPVESGAVNKPVEIQHVSVNELLNAYVDMELEQTRLVNAMHSVPSGDRAAKQQLVAEAMTHANRIRAFARDAIQHPDIKTETEKLKKTKPMTLSQCGGFIAVKERFVKNEFSNDDRSMLTMQLKKHAAEQSRSQTQDRDRGGRGR